MTVHNPNGVSVQIGIAMASSNETVASVGSDFSNTNILPPHSDTTETFIVTGINEGSAVISVAITKA